MTPPDDIKTETPASVGEKPPPQSIRSDRTPPRPPPKEVGPESEVRGGPEAPAD